MIIAGKFIDLNVPALPCHTQSVERHIKLVTEASSSVCDSTYRTFSRYLQILFEAGALGNCNTAELKFTSKLHLYKVAIKIDAIS